MLSLLTLRPPNESFSRLRSSDHILHRVRRQDFEHHLRAENKAFDEEIMVVLDGEIDFGLGCVVKKSFLLWGQGLEKLLLTRCDFGEQSGVNAVFLEITRHRLDIAEGEFFEQFHPDHHPSGTQRYHTTRRKSRNIFVNSALGFADPYVVIQTIYFCQEKNTHPP